MIESIVIVADYYPEEMTGGAELTTQALLDSAPFNLIKLKSKNVTMELLQKHHELHWVFGNWAGIDKNLLPTIITNTSYSVLEYDYKFCRYRSPEKHELAEKTPCGCHNEDWGRMAGAFYYGARSLWWMSEKQQARYLERYPELATKNQTVLSSVFSEQFWLSLKILREKYVSHERKGWLVLGSNSWIKGTEAAIDWCRENGKEYETIHGLETAEVLEKMAQAEGFVYLPPGGDTCPRMVIEAKLLGCELHLNENVEHKDEIWFNTTDSLETESYLYASRETFWNGIKEAMNWTPTVSGYTTTKDCIANEYPWIDTINSLLGFCDEVVVVDGGSTDGTWQELCELAKQNEKLVIKQIKRDWSSPRFAVFDGAQKAEARKLCTKEFCWQMDADEILLEKDWPKVHEMCRRMTPEMELLSLPVLEYWGSKQKARMDVNPWKWRLSRNKAHITHGIPAHLRKYDENGETYAVPGTDGCDYIHVTSGQYIPHATFYSDEAHHARISALGGDREAAEDYVKWITASMNNLPTIRHHSWLNIERKIKTYRNYWQSHWESLYNMKQEDTAENNMFFDKKWSEVTDKEIMKLAINLANKTGGHVFHTKVDLSKPTPYLSINE